MIALWSRPLLPPAIRDGVTAEDRDRYFGLTVFTRYQRRRAARRRTGPGRRHALPNPVALWNLAAPPPVWIQRLWGPEREGLLEARTRARIWRHVYGSDRVPILAPEPHLSRVDGVGVRSVYVVDVKALAPEVFQRVVAHLSSSFGDPPDVIRSALQAGEGIALPSEGLSVVTEGDRHWARLKLEDERC